MKMNDRYERLRRPFPESSIEYVVTWTYGDSYEEVMLGVAPYLKRESVIVRLDHVLGPESWRNELLPIGDGLYNGISIRNNDGEWITKFDGAAKGTAASGIDPVKAVATYSLRRTAELWGIGRYLKDLPQLFAVKRPGDEYGADEKTKVKRKGTNGFSVRWDHPPIPQEFLPTYMTPEQYYLLEGLKKYFSGEKLKIIEEFLDKWTKDNDSLTYEEAKFQIQTVQNAVQSRVQNHRATNIYPQPFEPNGANQGSKPKPQGAKPKPSPPANGSPKPKQDKKPESNGASKGEFSDQYAQKFRDVRDLITSLLEEDMVGVKIDRDPAQADLELLQKSVRDKTPIPEPTIDELLSYYSRAKADLDEADSDLPF